MGEVLYMLCALTSIGCVLLLMNRFRKTRVGLLFWSALAFGFFSATNILLFIDLALFPVSTDLSVPRNLLTLIGVTVLLYGLIRQSTS